MIEVKENGRNKLTISMGIIVIIALIFGIAVGRYILPKPVVISYISQQELLDLEKVRIQKQGLENRDLFLGKPERAIGLIKHQQKARNSKNNIVLLSERAIFGSNVKSISAKVHKAIIRNLKKGK